MVGRAGIAAVALVFTMVVGGCIEDRPPPPATTPPPDQAIVSTPTPTTATPAPSPSPTPRPSRTPTIIADCLDVVWGSISSCPGPGGPERIATRLDCSWSAGAAPGVYHVRAVLSARDRPMSRHRIDWTVPRGVQVTVDSANRNGETDRNGIVAITLTVATDAPTPLVIQAQFRGTPPRGGVINIGEPSSCTVEIPR